MQGVYKKEDLLKFKLATTLGGLHIVNDHMTHLIGPAGLKNI